MVAKVAHGDFLTQSGGAQICAQVGGQPSLRVNCCSVAQRYADRRPNRYSTPLQCTCRRREGWLS